jgi:hypothetical protein
MAVEQMRAVESVLAVGVPVDRVRRTIGALRERARQLMCAMHGHERHVHYTRGRMALRCIYCGLESAGWDVSGPPPVARVAGDPGRHVLARRE